MYNHKFKTYINNELTTVKCENNITVELFNYKIDGTLFIKDNKFVQKFKRPIYINAREISNKDEFISLIKEKLIEQFQNDIIEYSYITIAVQYYDSISTELMGFTIDDMFLSFNKEITIDDQEDLLKKWNEIEE